MSTTPSGWYPDPADDLQQRYWDGAGWTRQTRATPDSPQTPTSSTDPPSASTQPPAGDPPQTADAQPAVDRDTHTSPDATSRSTGRRGRTAALFSVGTVALVALAASAWLWFNNSSQTLELRLEPVAVTVDDAFTTSVAMTEHSLPDGLIVPDQTAIRLPQPDPNAPAGPRTLGSATQIAGSTPGIFGGTRNQQACDPDQLVAFLASDPTKAQAWAAVHGIDPADIEGFVARLTPLVLTHDTHVTNHGFRDGSAYQIQAILQAGTAILVDDRGLPMVKCGCGNPLLPPATITPDVELTILGTPWAGWHPDRVVVIGVDTRVQTFVTIDLDGGQPFLRPIGSTPDQDQDLPHDQLCQLITDHPTCTQPDPEPAPDPEPTPDPEPEPDPEPDPEPTPDPEPEPEPDPDPEPAPDPDPGPGGAIANSGANWASTATGYRGEHGQRVSYACPAGGTARTVWGTEVYTDDSSVCTAAVHAGLITLASGGNVVIEIRPGQTSYTGSQRHGITSRNWGSWGGSFVFVDDPTVAPQSEFDLDLADECVFGLGRPDACRTRNPRVTVQISSDGDTSRCEFESSVDFGDGTVQEQTYPGRPDGAIGATFLHTYTGPGVYTIVIDGRSPTEGCSLGEGSVTLVLE